MELQASINHTHRLRRLELGMLVRHYSLPDRDLRRGRAPPTQRHHRHGGFSERTGAPSPTIHAKNKTYVVSGEGALTVCRGNRERQKPNSTCGTATHTREINDSRVTGS